MPAVKKTINQTTFNGAIISDTVKSRANDPFFVKKAEEAKKSVSRISFPEEKK